MKQRFRDKIDAKLDTLVAACETLLKSSKAKKEEYMNFDPHLLMLEDLDASSWFGQSLTIDTMIVGAGVGTAALFAAVIKKRYFSPQKQTKVALI